MTMNTHILHMQPKCYTDHLLSIKYSKFVQIYFPQLCDFVFHFYFANEDIQVSIAAHAAFFFMRVRESTSWTLHLLKQIAMVSAGCVDALLSETCLTLQHLSGLDRNNP